VDKASIDFWSDSTTGGSGVAVPKSWKVQYWDGTAFQDVTGATGFDPAVRGSTNNVSFDPVTTTRLRATFNGLPNAAGTAYSAVGVSEWRVFATAASSIQGVDARTQVGVAPALPATVDVTYADGTTLPVAVSWGQIDPAELAAAGDFTVSGFVNGTTLTATAHVWVRGSDPVQINTIDPVTVATQVGVAPKLPTGVTVGYNDGSRQSGIAVTWASIDPSKYAAAGTFDVTGQVAGTDKTATATVVVGDGGSPAQFDVQVQAKTQCIGGKAYVAVNAVNADDRALDLELVTPYGTKKVPAVAPGKTAYQQFTSRSATVAAGVATVNATGGSVTTEIQAPYGASSCG
jgi:hypothetical protein